MNSIDKCKSDGYGDYSILTATDTSKRQLWMSGVLVLTAAVYLPTISHPFQYDDYYKVLHNPSMKSPLGVIRSALTEGHYESATRLLPNVTIALDALVFGDSPAGFNLTNLLIHLLNVWLVGRFVHTVATRSGSTLNTTVLSITCALLFALHPLNSEAVNYCNARPNMMCATFILLTLLFFLKYTRRASSEGRGGGKWAWLMLLSAAGAFLSKELGLILIALIPLVATISRVRLFGTNSGARIAMACVVLVGVMSAAMLGSGSHVSRMLFGDQSDGGPLLGRTLTVLGQSELLLKYLGLGVLPVPDLLSIDHSVIALHSRIWSHSNGMPGLIAILAIPICSVMFILLWVMWAMRNRRRFPLVTLCCFWIVVGHLPTMVFPRNEQFVEYRSYVPMIGFTLLVSLGMMRAHELLSQRFKHARTTLGSTLLPMVIVGGLLTSTISRNAVWASKADLWMDAARKAPHSWRTNNNAGVELMEEGRFHAALSYLERGTGCHPHSFMNHVSLAECLHRLGDDSRAISEYEAGLREGSNQKGVLMNLSQLLMERGKSDRALEYLGRVIQLDPKDPEPRELLGRALVVRGRYEEAMTHLKWAVELGLDTEMLRKEISKCEAAMQAHDRRK